MPGISGLCCHYFFLTVFENAEVSKFSALHSVYGLDGLQPGICWCSIKIEKCMWHLQWGLDDCVSFLATVATKSCINFIAVAFFILFSCKAKI